MAYTQVVFAFLTFSSSPYEVVYWIPENTMAPIANKAPNAIIVFAVLLTSAWMAVTQPQPFVGLIAFSAFPAHLLR